jgi:hypothetical protein
MSTFAGMKIDLRAEQPENIPPPNRDNLDPDSKVTFESEEQPVKQLF